ncbi:MAG: undecaprenyl-diphosphate phosphatase [Actinomycetota bacterium]
MNFWQSAILGLIQGLTEFLPVSSSAHLVIAPHVLGWAQPSVFFDVVLHAGTLLAAILYFRRDLAPMITKQSRTLRDKDGRINTLWLLLLATIPAAGLGFIFKSGLESYFDNPAAAATLLIVTGFIMTAADLLGRQKKKMEETSPAAALLIGAFQALAILPGISRSGATISAGMFAGLKREDATRFAFLLSVPIIAGTAIYKTKDVIEAGGAAAQLLASLPGALVAATAGYLAIRFMLKYLAGHRLTVFAVYCWAAGGLFLLTR